MNELALNGLINLLSFEQKTMDSIILFIEKIPRCDSIR